jgi:hypothetical protein
MIRIDREEKRKRWSVEENKFLRRNYDKKNIAELAQELGRPVSSVGAAVYALRLKKTKQNVRSKK